MDGQKQNAVRSAADRVASALGEGSPGLDKQADGDNSTEVKAAEKAAEKSPETAPSGVKAPEGFVSRDEVAQLIADGVKNAMATHKNDAEALDTRQRFLIQKMGDLPTFAHDLMPKTKDVKELAKAEQDIRGQLTEWFKRQAEASGLKIGNIGGGPAGQSAMAPGEVTVGGNSATARVHRALQQGK